ncbi:phosphoribosylamine--glycine ligase [Salinisphaera sp. USBA-960]|nr:phosphoribosylamine--glycine ligase [Salifodinibacter halophilus]NNC26279.1 phosphoribosylamine--glycine ligase [Salifodinibacter halophilus]
MHRILVVGGGGREHALAWKIAASPRAESVFVAPGNAGTALDTRMTNVAIADDDTQALVDFARENEITLTVIGPEAPLAAGVVDGFEAAGLACFGPNAAAAELEASKSFSKDFLYRHDIPTADYAVFTDDAAAIDFIASLPPPIVIKADGLASGKGVEIAPDRPSAETAAQRMLADSGRIVVERYLEGEEASFMVMVDGTHIVPLASSQDHKPAFDGDTGPNTGGMGAYSPAPVVTDAVAERAMRQIIEPTVHGMAADGRAFRGFLYAGLMIDSDNNPRVLEFNVRLGDPETQPICMRLASDLVDLVEAGVNGDLNTLEPVWHDQVALGVVMASAGYPGSIEKGHAIRGLDAVDNTAIAFHAGTRLGDGDSVRTAGGRVLCMTALGSSIADAQASAYRGAAAIDWPGAWYRGDIGHRALERHQDL